MSDRTRMTIDAAYNHGDRVRHLADEDDERGIVVAIIVGPQGLLYRVAWCHSDTSDCYEMELASADAKAET